MGTVEIIWQIDARDFTSPSSEGTLVRDRLGRGKKAAWSPHWKWCG